MELSARRERFFKLNTRLSSISDEALGEIFANPESLAAVNQSRSKKHLLKLGSNKVFIKRLPLSKSEFQRGFSTKNHFALPGYYSYGNHSLGFGAYRHLLSHIKTTNWVLEGECSNFPMLYHYRVVPALDDTKFSALTQCPEYKSIWKFSNNICHYLEEKAQADFEIILFMEYFPQNLQQWLEKSLSKAPDMTLEIRKALMFLRQNGLLHFDPSLSNILCDGKLFVLNDFTLAMDKRFELYDEERLFLGKNANFDYARFLYSSAKYLMHIFHQMDETKQQRLIKGLDMEDDCADEDIFKVILENLDEVQSKNLMPLHKNYVTILENCREVILYAHDFNCDFHADPGKGIIFNDRKAGRLLAGCGFI